MLNYGVDKMVCVRRRLQATAGQPRFVHTSSPGGAERRTAAEGFIRDCFRHHYGAEISQFMPQLMSLSNEQDELQAVLGFRHADPGPLFLEHYLDRPVEQLLASRIRQPVDRSHLVEVGNLAVATAGGGRWLITALTAYLSATSAEWVLFTIGPAIYNAFTRMGLELIDLAEARREALPPGERMRWGNYYDQKPRVMAGNIAYGYDKLWSLCQREAPMRELWRNAERAGGEAA